MPVFSTSCDTLILMIMIIWELHHVSELLHIFFQKWKTIDAIVIPIELKIVQPVLLVAQKSSYTHHHYNDVIMSAMASQIISVFVVYSTVYSGADQRKQQSSASLAFAPGIHRWPVRGPVARKTFPLDDVIMIITVAPMCLHGDIHDGDIPWATDSPWA